MIRGPEESEKAIIWLCIHDLTLYESCGLKSSDFSSEIHRVLWTSMGDLADRGVPLDPISIIDNIPQPNPVKLSQLADCIESPADSEKFDVYVSNIKSYSRTKELISLLASYSMRAGSGEPAEMLSVGLQVDLAALEQGTARTTLKLGDVAASVTTESISISRGDKKDETAITTGYDAIDNAIGGIHRGKLLVVGGRPSMGKSALARSMGLRAAGRGYKTLLITPEDTAQTAAARCLSERSKVPLFRIIRNQLRPEDTKPLEWAAKELEEYPFTIDDTGGISIEGIAGRCAAEKPDILIVDYIQLVTTGEKERLEEVNKVVRTLVAIARRNNMAVIAVSQLSRRCEFREDKRPMMSDLRESGEIEQCANAVLFCYRDSYYNSGSDPLVGEIIVAKNKSGPTETVVLSWGPSVASYL